MGSDPETSVADGRGELHDVKGVWIGDASAFPTAPGVNPMVTIMSLARTAGRGDRGRAWRMTSRLERTEGSFEYDGRRLAYDVIGDGERTVVLTHGLLMDNRMYTRLSRP